MTTSIQRTPGTEHRLDFDAGMNAERLLTHFDRIADAPDAVPCLRRFILDLAVRGKLVPQDPDDEPASELLKRVAAEKARLVRAGELRKPKRLPGIEELPYSLPDSWCWVPIREVTSDHGQCVPQAAFTYVDVTAIEQDKGFIANPRVLKANEAPSRARKVVRKGDVVYSCVRPYLLNVAVIEEAYDPLPIASTAFAVLNGHGLVLPWLQWIVLRSPFMVARVEEEMRGQAYPAINDREFSRLPFPLPPLAEQHRIVAKVDELMTLCDRLEAARTDREATRNRLAAASLARLNAPDPDSAVFRNDAAFALDNLTPLTTRPDQIKALRQTILNLAVRGKLVPQDPTEGTGEKLKYELERARCTWKMMWRARMPKDSNRVSDDEKYLDLPHSWAWVRLVDVGQTQTGTTPSSADPVLFGDFIPFIKPADLDGKEINCSGSGLSESGLAHSRLVPENSLLMVCIGATLGKVNKTTRAVCFNQQINSLTPFIEEVADFVVLALKASDFRELAWSKAGTGTLPIISKGKWEVLSVPLPPLAEQHRIVAKVDELMALCDRLEASLTTGDETRGRLLESVLHEALEVAADGDHGHG